MMDYLLWRGDLLFREAPFNEVDNLIFSELVYVDFGNIVPGVDSNASITLKEASEEFFKHHTEESFQHQNGGVSDEGNGENKAFWRCQAVSLY